jgi:ABC-type branched-subunit amino acid transport system substrate-binding protein
MYDAAIILALAIQKAGTSTNGTAVRDALYAISRPGPAYGPARLGEAITAIKSGLPVDYSGASGSVSFDDNGDVLSDYIVWEVERRSSGGYGYTTVGNIKATELE